MFLKKKKRVTCYGAVCSVIMFRVYFVAAQEARTTRDMNEPTIHDHLNLDRKSPRICAAILASHQLWQWLGRKGSSEKLLRECHGIPRWATTGSTWQTGKKRNNNNNYNPRQESNSNTRIKKKKKKKKTKKKKKRRRRRRRRLRKRQRRRRRRRKIIIKNCSNYRLDYMETATARTTTRP